MSRTCKDPRQMELHFGRFGRPGALWENYFISSRPVMYADYEGQRPFSDTDVRRAMDEAVARNLAQMAAEVYRRRDAETINRAVEVAEEYRGSFLGMTWTTADLETEPDPAAGSLTIADVTRARALFRNLENDPNG